MSGEIDQQSVSSTFGVVEQRAANHISVGAVEQRRAAVGPETAGFGVGERRSEVGEVVAYGGQRAIGEFAGLIGTGPDQHRIRAFGIR